LPSRIERRVLQVVTKLGLMVEAETKKNLSDRVLRVRTGRLRASIARDIRQSGTAVEAIVGTNVKYARVHEYGFSGTQNVRAHLRTIKQAWGKQIQPRQVEVRAHARTVNLPARSFLRTALREIAPYLEPELRKAIADEVAQ
jgi:phage gpG-like protein